MELNYLGLVSALAVFLSIWWGHVGVRKIEARSVRLWPIIVVAILLGIGFEIVAAYSDNIYLSSACGILGVIFLWDAFEFYRQQNRVKKGYSPANPNNSRHAQILAEYPDSTILEWLDRHPRGLAYSAKELDEMKASAK